MNNSPSSATQTDRGGEWLIPLSAINQFLYCHRRVALIHVEGIFTDNVHTIRGDIVHEHTDLAGYEVARGVKLLRALPVFSDRLGLNGKCDVVEQRPDGTLYPVEFKLGKRRQWGNDDAQLCAQTLCLEEMFQKHIERGAIFHAASKRRREVEFTLELRALTEKAVAELRQILEAVEVPAAVFKPACEQCSLFDTCLPKVTSSSDRVTRAAQRLFETKD